MLNYSIPFLRALIALSVILGSENAFAITKSIVKTDSDSNETSKMIEGEILIGNFFSNSTYTATPKNDGLVENRYAMSLTYHPTEQIGRARVGKECLRLCRSRWSPYH